MKFMMRTVAWFLSVMVLMVVPGRVAMATNVTEEPQQPVEVAPITDDDLRLSLKYGTRIVIPEGVEYYASADGFGSGASGVIGGQYTSMGMDAYIGGFALLDEEGRLVEHLGYTPEKIPVAESWKNDTGEISWERVWIGFFVSADGYAAKNDSLTGWLPARSIAVINGIMGDGGSNVAYRNGVTIKPETDTEIELQYWTPEDLDPEDMAPEVIDSLLPDPGNMIEDRVIAGQDNEDSEEEPFISTREIAYAIEDYADKGEKVALLLDASGSVTAYMKAIAAYGEYVDKVNKADIIIVFANKYKVIRAEDYLKVNVGSRTDIYSPLNSLTNVSSCDRIIMVTDTYHNVDNTLDAGRFEEFKGKIVIVSPIALQKVDMVIVEEIEEAFGTTVYLCLLNNELDRIRALEAMELVK